MTRQVSSRRSANWRVAGILLVVLLAVYNSNLRLIPSLDSDAIRVLPICILLDHSVYLDRFAKEWVNTYWHTSGPGHHTHAIMHRCGHWISTYPIVTPLLITPLYIPLAWFIHRYNPPIDSVLVIRLISLMEKLSASLIAALSAVFVYLVLFELTNGSRRTALMLALVYAVGSNIWVIGSQALWLHAMTALLMSAALWLLLCGGNRPGWLAGAGLAIALATANRPPTLVLAGLLAFYVCLRYGRHAWPFFLGATVVALPYFAYNLYFFGSLTGVFTAQSGWTTPPLQGLAGLLASPSRGLFVYTPWTIFAFAGAIAALLMRGQSGLMKCIAIAAFGELLLYSRWWSWWGGSCFGPRLLTDILPLLTILLLPALDIIRSRMLLKSIFVATVVFAVGVQVVGAYFDWRLELEPPQFWSWRDSQLLDAVHRHELVTWSPRRSGLAGELRGRK